MGTTTPFVSQHAQERQAAYVGSDADAEAMWEGGLPLVDHGCHADEVRYDPKHEVVLIRKNEVITTMINVDSSTRPQTREAVGRAVEFYGDERIDRG